MVPCIDAIFYIAFLLPFRAKTQDAGRMQQPAKKKRQINN